MFGITDLRHLLNRHHRHYRAARPQFHVLPHHGGALRHQSRLPRGGRYFAGRQPADTRHRIGRRRTAQALPALFHGIKLAGGLYLAYIGWNLLRGAVKKWRMTPPATTSDGLEDKGNAPPHIFNRALLLSLTNPKAILFFLSFFVQFVDPAYPNPALSFFVLALILQLTSFIYLNLLVFAGHGLTQAFRRHIKTSAAAMGLVGVLFIGFAVKMWTSGI